jgi:hypothetical protein
MKIFSSIGVAALLLLALTGCSQSPFSAASAPAAVAPAAVVNDLAAGSVVRLLAAGDAALSITYWSTLTMDRWTAAAEKPLSLSLQATLGTDVGQQVYLSKLSVGYIVIGPTGALSEGPAPFADVAAVVPGYLVKAPYSYSQNLVVPAVDATATGVQVTATYEVLVQAAPGSGDYAKQTASETFTVAIAR